MKTEQHGDHVYAVIRCEMCGEQGLSLDPDVVMPFLPPGWIAVSVNGARASGCSQRCASLLFEMMLDAPTLQPSNPLPTPAHFGRADEEG